MGRMHEGEVGEEKGRRIRVSVEYRFFDVGVIDGWSGLWIDRDLRGVFHRKPF